MVFYHPNFSWCRCMFQRMFAYCWKWKITITYCLSASHYSPKWKKISCKKGKKEGIPVSIFSTDCALPLSWIGPLTTLFNTLPKENGLLCIKLLSVVCQICMFYSAKAHNFTGKLWQGRCCIYFTWIQNKSNHLQFKLRPYYCTQPGFRLTVWSNADRHTHAGVIDFHITTA